MSENAAPDKNRYRMYMSDEMVRFFTIISETSGEDMDEIILKAMSIFRHHLINSIDGKENAVIDNCTGTLQIVEPAYGPMVARAVKALPM